MRAALRRTVSFCAAAGFSLLLNPHARASTGVCDISPGEYTAWSGTDKALELEATTSAGVSQARCFKDIRNLGGFVVEGVFRDASGRYANELPSYGKLFNMFPGENYNTICNGLFGPAQRNSPSVQCVPDWNKTFGQAAEFANKLDWKYVNPVRYDPKSRAECPTVGDGCFSGRCFDRECVESDGSLKVCPSGNICLKGTCAPGIASSRPTCTSLDPQAAAIGDGDTRFYLPWNAMVFDMGGLSNKVAIFAVNDHGPQPCESNEYTVYLTNNPLSREIIDDPTKTGADPNKWNRAKLHKIFTHGWIDNPNCCADPKTCDPLKCPQPKPGDPPVLEADSMSIVFTLPCGISFRYASFIAGYDGKSLGDPSKGEDRCTYHSFDAEVDAVAGLNDDETAICPDKDGDGFPACECTPAGKICDCVDDPAKNPDAKKYYPGAPQACDGPQYSCSPFECPTGSFCHSSQCLKPCAKTEVATRCDPGFACTDVDETGKIPKLCVPAPCGTDGVCAPGLECKEGKCTDPCAPPTKCPVGQVCQGGKCLDPCALIKCPAGKTCNAGSCVDNCACLAKDASIYPCKGDTPSCDKEGGKCVPKGCDAVKCPAPNKCVSGVDGAFCAGPCEGVVCPSGLKCDDVRGCVGPCDLRTSACPDGTVCKTKSGECVETACVDIDCTAPFECKGGKCIDPVAGDFCLSCDSGTSDATPLDASNADSGISDTSVVDTGFSDNPAATPNACGCEAPGRSPETLALGILGFAGLGIAIARRRKRG